MFYGKVIKRMLVCCEPKGLKIILLIIPKTLYVVQKKQTLVMKSTFMSFLGFACILNYNFENLLAMNDKYCSLLCHNNFAIHECCKCF